MDSGLPKSGVYLECLDIRLDGQIIDCCDRIVVYRDIEHRVVADELQVENRDVRLL